MNSKLIMQLQAGEPLDRRPNNPTIFVVGTGRNMYLWVGNDADEDKFCFATLSGTSRLRQLAEEILDRLPK